MTPWGALIQDNQISSVFSESSTLLDLGQYDFVIINMYKKSSNLDSISLESVEGFKAWKDSLIIPPDYSLKTSEWMTKVAVKIDKCPPDLIIPSLRLLDHYGVNSVLLDIEIDMSKVIEFLESNSTLKIMILCSENNFSSWQTLWRSNKILMKNVKVALILNGEGNVPQWISEPIGLALVDARHMKDYNEVSRLLSSSRYNVPIAMLNPECPVADWKSLKPILTYQEKLRLQFVNALQSPLQPLRDNLNSEAYEVFEEDKIKYKLYTTAIRAAIEKLSHLPFLRIAVCGAGRGPLVLPLIKASSCLPSMKIFIVEKNPNAIITYNLFVHTHNIILIFAAARLLHKYEHVKEVEIIHEDMRNWKPKAGPLHLIITELLGGFGDNELSPECIQGIERLLDPDGIIIPQSYSSWIEPIYSPIIRQNILNVQKGSTDPFQTPYTCQLEFHQCPSEPKKVFSFFHPLESGSVPNSMSKELIFPIKEECLIDGLGGYFEANLCQEISLSILPKNHTPNMASWFPLFFPLIEPLRARKGQTIHLHFKRENDGEKVWYSWKASSSASDDSPAKWHNERGEHFCMKL